MEDKLEMVSTRDANKTNKLWIRSPIPDTKEGKDNLHNILVRTSINLWENSSRIRQITEQKEAFARIYVQLISG